MTVIVSGDRHWYDKDRIREFLIGLPRPVTVVHGAAKGADSLTGEVAKELGMTVTPVPANWNAYGRAAGPIRNKAMLDQAKPDLVLAFHDDLSKSKGTKNMVTLARKAGVPVKLITHEHWEWLR